MYVLLLLCTVNNAIRARRNKIPDEVLLENYNVSLSIKAILDEHKEELFEAFTSCNPDVCLQKRRVYEFPWLPGYVVKKNLSRIRGVERARRIAEENNLDCIEFPEKRAYEVDGRVFIIVPKVNPDPNPEPFTLRQVQQLWKFVLKSNYNDLHKENYMRLKNGKIVIIDTEQRSFGRMFRGLARFIRNHYPHDYEEDAFKYVLENLADYFAHNIPQDIHNLSDRIIQKYGRNSYPVVYKIMYENLTAYERVFDWDYVTYFKEHFPDPSLPPHNEK